MAEFDLEDIQEIYNQADIMNLLIEKGIVKEKKLVEQIQYEKELSELQFELLRLQSWLIENKKKMMLLFEGRDAAGKGGTIKRMVMSLNPKHYRVVALPKPTEKELKQWYFQKFIQHFPENQEQVFFDRSWYNRAVVEPVFGFCTDEQHEAFLNQVGMVEKLIIEEGIIFIKFFLSISKEEQQKQLDQRREDPMKQYKIGGLDEQAQDKWDDYTTYIEKMFEKTSFDYSPWIEIKTDSKKTARLEAIKYLLNHVDGFKTRKEYSVDNQIVIKHV